VTGIVNKSLESALISQSEGELLRISVPYSYEMRVVATDAIKGKLSKSIINGTTWCSQKINIETKVYVIEKGETVFILSEKNVELNYPEIYKELAL
jgi:hypothetical protein